MKAVEEQKRKAESQKRQLRRLRLYGKIKNLIADIWSLFPKGGLDRCRLECLRVSTADYGSHQAILGYGQIPFGGTKFGIRSMGLWYENGHLEEHHGHQMCSFSRQHLQFLLKIQECLHCSFPKTALRESMAKFLRVQLVVGAQTAEHTDTMRGSTPNFILIEPDSTFILRVRLFPNFHSSVVLYQSKFYIPLSYCPSSLVMIGLNDAGSPFFFKFPPETINKLEPVGDLKHFIVVGIKQQKIQVLSSQYSVHYSTASLDCLTFEEVMAEAIQNPVKAKPKRMYKLLHGGSKWHMFHGWKHSHKWIEGTDWHVRRIHVFYRPIREETSAARPRTYIVGK